MLTRNTATGHKFAGDYNPLLTLRELQEDAAEDEESPLAALGSRDPEATIEEIRLLEKRGQVSRQRAVALIAAIRDGMN